MKPAIVIFGAAVRPGGRPSATLRRRVEVALGCAERLDRPVFIPTGAVGRHPPAEAEVMRNMLASADVAADHILTEPTGTDTLSSVRAVRSLLRTRADVGPVYVATSRYHLPRCVLLMRLAGVPARACRPLPPPSHGPFSHRWYWRLREVPALPYDAALMFWLRATGRL